MIKRAVLRIRKKTLDKHVLWRMFSISIEIHSNTKENAAFYFEKISIVIQELRFPWPYTDEEDGS